MLLNCDLEKTLESPLECKEIQPVYPTVLNIHWKDWCWSWNSNTLATWCEELTHLKRPCSWKRLKAREGDNRGWNGWLASPIRWTWVWASSRSWWWTGKPGMLQSMGSQRVRHNWVTELSNLNTLSLEGLVMNWSSNWLPDTKNWFIGKNPDAGKYWRWKEKGMTEDEIVVWHHWLHRNECE